MSLSSSIAGGMTSLSEPETSEAIAKIVSADV